MWNEITLRSPDEVLDCVQYAMRILSVVGAILAYESKTNKTEMLINDFYQKVLELDESNPMLAGACQSRQFSKQEAISGLLFFTLPEFALVDSVRFPHRFTLATKKKVLATRWQTYRDLDGEFTFSGGKADKAIAFLREHSHLDVAWFNGGSLSC